MSDSITVVNLSAIDLNLLLVLHAVLEERSVARAAERLHVTPPAVSNALARLRAIVGDPLLVRSGRGLTPTPRALELAPVLARTLGDLERAVLGAPLDPSTTTRELTIALSDADQIALLPALATRFAARFPRARLRVVSIDTLLSGGGLAAADVDLAIGPEERGPGLYAAPLYEEDGVLVVRRGHPTIRRTITAARFNAARHVDIHLALGRGGSGHRAVEDVFARHGLVRDVAVIVPTFAAAAMVAASTDLVAGMPRRLAKTFAALVPITIVEMPQAAMRFHMHLLWHARTHDDPAARLFRDLVREVAAPRTRGRAAPFSEK